MTSAMELLQTFLQFVGGMGRFFLALPLGTKIMIIFPLIWMGFNLDRMENSE